jgi:hypothetical protein
MKYEYQTTTGFFGDTGDRMHTPKVIEPEGNGWTMVGCACDCPHVFWFWRRIANKAERRILFMWKGDTEATMSFPDADVEDTDTIDKLRREGFIVFVGAHQNVAGFDSIGAYRLLIKGKKRLAEMLDEER